jgi:hypothetical protein
MLRPITTIAIILLTVSNAFSLGWESFGNTPFADVRNYADWPNVLPVINDTHRVYHSWVNGNEHFYFAGDTTALNDALKNFAAVQADGLTIVVRPGPGKGGSFNNEKSFTFNWMLHLLGGISRHMSREELGINIWDSSPYLHVYVGDAIKLDQIEIPNGVAVLEIADLQARYAKCLASGDRTVRGWSCSHIARLDPYNAESMRQVADKLADNDNWVKLNAAGALSLFTGLAEEVIEKLQAVETDDEQLQTRIAKSIEALQSAQPGESARQEHQQQLESIHAFIVPHRQGR